MASLADMMYGTAQNAAQEQGQGLPQAVTAGADLAFKKQNLDLQQQAMQQKMQEIQSAKVDKAMGWFETSTKMDPGPMRDAFVKQWIPNGLNAIGLQDVFHPDALKMAQSNPALVGFLSAGMKAQQTLPNGSPNPNYIPAQQVFGAMGNADQMATFAADPRFKAFGAQQDIQGAMQTDIAQLKGAADTQASEAAKLAQAKATAQAAAIRQQNTFTHDDTKDLQSFKTHIVDKVNTSVAPLAKEAKEISVATQAGNRLQAAIDAGKTNYPGAAADAESVKNAYLRSVVSRVTENERESLGVTPGMEGILRQKNIKWGMGGFNPEMMGGVIKLVNGQVGTLNEQLQQQKQLVNDEVDSSRWSDHKDEIVKPVNNYLGKLGDTKPIGASFKSAPTAMLVQYLANPKNASHPDYAAIQAELKSRGGKN